MWPDDILWLSGMPRSGTTWIAQILASHPDIRLKYDPLFSFSFKNALDESHGTDDWERLFRAVYTTSDPYMDQVKPIAEGLVPSFPLRMDAPRVLAIKSNRHHDLIGHAVRIGVKARFVFVVRDPIDTIASWLANPTEFPAGENPAAEWRSGRCRKTGCGEYWGFDDWKHVAELNVDLAKRFPERVRLLRYEEILEAPEAITHDLFAWIGLDLSEQTIGFLRESRSRHSENPRSVYRQAGRHRSHRDALPPGAERTMISELEGTALARFLRQPLERNVSAED